VKALFHYLRLRTRDRGWQAMAEALGRHTLPAWQAEGLQVWGVWQGLFGVASNELLLIGVSEHPEVAAPIAQALPSGVEVVDRLGLKATARPRSVRPLTPEGLYVFRFFDVAAAHVDEIVALSREAWETFERTDRYAARPEGLFRPHGDGQDAGRMLLLTWYDGFGSWQTSRSPAPEARRNFLRRHELTGGTVALATRLLPDLTGVR
jgi:hypothetical protein